MRLSSTVVLLFGLALASAASAKEKEREKEDPTLAKVRDLFKSGSKHFELAEYAPALDDFREAYRLRQDPVFLFNIAQCHRFLGNHEEASRFYKNYLRNMPTAPNKAEVEGHIRAEDALADEAKRRAQEAAATDARRRDLELQAALAKKPPPAPWYMDTLGWVLGGAGLALTGAGVGILAYGATIVVPTSPPAHMSMVQTTKDRQTAFIASGAAIGGVGLAALVVGVVKLAIFDKPEAPAVSFVPAAGGGALVVTGSW